MLEVLYLYNSNNDVEAKIRKNTTCKENGICRVRLS